MISFILNFAVFGASGVAHNFPQWWGNGAFSANFSFRRRRLTNDLVIASDFSLSADRCLLPDN